MEVIPGKIISEKIRRFLRSNRLLAFHWSNDNGYLEDLAGDIFDVSSYCSENTIQHEQMKEILKMCVCENGEFEIVI